MGKAPTALPTDIPSKWDIIPIHTSDVASYMRCRRYWDWSSPTRTNLRHKVGVYGVKEDLWFGSGIHYALEMFYNPVIKRDPVEAFTTWFYLQWNGGLVSEDWLDRSYDPSPKKLEGQIGASIDFPLDLSVPDQQLYSVEGLKNLLPDDKEAEFKEWRELGIGMLEYYKTYAETHDDFVVVAAESTFSIPLGFTAIDIREDSPNYGKELEVHARGKRDAIKQNVRSEQYGIIDYKTMTRYDEENYMEALNLDPQCTNYLWASTREAELYDRPWTKPVEITYQAMRKKFPRSPTPLQNGLPSMNRQEEATTAELFKEYIEKNNLQVWFDDNIKAQNYYEWLVETADEQYVRRTSVFRNKAMIENAGRHLTLVAKEMLSDPAIYPNPSKNWLCVNCQFRSPCIAKEDGSDYAFMLKDGYEQNPGR